MQIRSFAVPMFLGCLFLAACNRDLSPLNTTGTSSVAPAAPVIASSDMFDNFEYGLDFNPLWCCPQVGCWGGPCGAQIEWSTDYAMSGTHSWKIKGIKNNNPGATWGPYAWLDSSLMVPHKTNFAGANFVKVWMRSTAPITVRFHWVEGSSGGGQGEEWKIEDALPGSVWHEFIWPKYSFTTACSPIGDGIPNVNDVKKVAVDFSTAFPLCGGTGNEHTMTFPGPVDLYVDDVRFSP